jgi:hypothetical protein
LASRLPCTGDSSRSGWTANSVAAEVAPVKGLDFCLIMHMIIVMAKHEPMPEPPPFLRRRVVFELTVEELPLLDEAEREHGTKRRALVRALEQLRASGVLAAKLEAAEATAAKLKKELAGERKNREASEKQRTKLGAEVKKAKASSTDANRNAEDESRRGEELEQILAEREQEISALERELAEAEDEILEELFCARCGEWVSAAAYGWKKTETGRYAYHKGCGDHGPGLMTPSSWLGWRRR